MEPLSRARGDEPHYIPIFETDIASFALRNYGTVKGKERWWEFVTKDRRISKQKPGMDTWELMKLMREIPDLLKPLTASDERIYKHIAWRGMDRSNFAELDIMKEDSRYKHGMMFDRAYITELYEVLDPAGVAALMHTDVEEIIALTDFRDEKEDPRIVIEKARKRVGKGYGVVQYKFSKKAGDKGEFGGRLFANRGVQGLKGAIRGLLLGRKTTDFDMSNCHPRIIVWLCQREGIDCRYMSHFIENRQAVYDQIGGEDPKETVLKAMNTHDKCPAGFDKDFYEELQNIRDSICELDVAKQFYTQARADWNRKGSLLNLVLCHYENEFLLDTLDFIQIELGISVSTLMFDGLMVYGDHYAEAKSICEKLTRNLQTRHGIHMPFVAKPHNKDLFPLLRRFNDTGEFDDKEEKLWQKRKMLIRSKMAKLVDINREEAERLYKKFHRLGLCHQQQLDEIQKSIRNFSMHGDFYLDTETCPYGKHQVYAISVSQGGGGPTFSSTIKTHPDPVKAALSWIIDRADPNFGPRDFEDKTTLKARIHIHNLTYDISQLIPYLTRFDTVEKGTSIYSAHAKYIDFDHKVRGEPRSIELFFVDTLKLIPHPLSKFGEMFKLKQSKEFMPHNMMTNDLVFRRKGIVSREKLLREVKGRGAAWAGKARKAVRARAAATAARSEADVVGTQALMRKAERLEEKAREAEKEADVAEEKGIKARDDRVTLFKNLRDWGCEVSPGQFDMINYSARYCDIDTQVLREGFEKYRQMMLEGFDIDVHSHVSVASIADRYYQDEGVYRGVCELRGLPRDFIAQANVGGRVMMQGNKKHRFLSNSENMYARIADLDAVSLYPSAQVRLMNELGGILMGKPKVWSKDIDLSMVDGYFIKIQQLPCVTSMRNH